MSIRVKQPDAFVKKPEIVLFDLDNTIYEYDRCHQPALRESLLEICRRFNLPYETAQTAYESARSTTKANLGESAASHSRLLYFHSTMDHLGLGAQVPLVLQLEQIYWRVYLAHMEVEPGAMEFIDYLRRSGIVLGLVTDLTAQIQFRKIVYLDLVDAFDAVVCSEETVGEKSSGRPYTLVLEKLGASSNEEIWMIGDSKVDVLPAKQAIGATAIHFAKYVDAQEDADLCFSDFEALTTFFRDQFYD